MNSRSTKDWREVFQVRIIREQISTCRTSDRVLFQQLRMRERFYFFWTFWETAQAITDPTQRLEYLEAVIRHGIGDEEKELSPLVNALMVQTRFTLDRSQEISDSASERWKKWWAPKWNQNAKKNWEIISKQPDSSKNKQEQTKTSEEEVEEEVEEEIEVEKENKEKESTSATTTQLSAKISYMNGMRNVEIRWKQLINKWNSITHKEEIMNEELKKAIYNIQSIPLSTFEERVTKYQSLCDRIKETKSEKLFYYPIRERDLLKFISKINRFYWEDSLIISKIADKWPNIKDIAVKRITQEQQQQTTTYSDLLQSLY